MPGKEYLALRVPSAHSTLPFSFLGLPLGDCRWKRFRAVLHREWVYSRSVSSPCALSRHSTPSRFTPSPCALRNWLSPPRGQSRCKFVKGSNKKTSGVRSFRRKARNWRSLRARVSCLRWDSLNNSYIKASTNFRKASGWNLAISFHTAFGIGRAMNSATSFSRFPMSPNWPACRASKARKMF